MKDFNCSLALIFFMLISNSLFSYSFFQQITPDKMLKDLIEQDSTMDVIINTSNVYNQYQNSYEGVICVHRMENSEYQLTAHPDEKHMINPDKISKGEESLFDKLFAATQNKEYHESVVVNYYTENYSYKQATVYRLSPQDICAAVSNKYYY